MAATPIAAPSKYINPGTTKYYFCSTISSKTAPTRSELNAGTDLTRAVMELEGFSTTTNQVETPDGDTRYTSTIPGRISAEDSSITFYADETGTDARALMPRDTNGFIVILDGGDTAGRKMNVYPVRVGSVSIPRSIEGEDAASVVISYSITSEPAENVTIPA